MSLISRVEDAGNSLDCDYTQLQDIGPEKLRVEVYKHFSSSEIAKLAQDNPEKARNEIVSICKLIFQETPGLSIDKEAQGKLIEDFLDLIFGMGPIETLLANKNITEIMVNSTNSIYYETAGILHKYPNSFTSQDQVRALIDRIIGPIGRRIDESSPMVNARLPQGHRVHAIIPPLAIDGPVLTIRKFTEHVIKLDEMVVNNSLDAQLCSYLKFAVHLRKNIAVSGGTGSGKTTLLNALSCEIPTSERIITIEDSAELRFLEHPHVVRLEARVMNAEGVGEVSIKELVINALRMRPDRIVVGECRSSEALDMLQAMNTGHDGSLTTLHANSPSEAVQRLCTMVRYDAELPIDVIKTNIASAIDIIVQVNRDPSGNRYIQNVCEFIDKNAEGSGQVDIDTKLKQIYSREYFEDLPAWEFMPMWLVNAKMRDKNLETEVKLWQQATGL